jgi:hypothetical protein
MLWQDWITIRTQSHNIVQQPEAWLDLGEACDVVLFLDVREATSPASIALYYETSPTHQGQSFFENVSITPVVSPTPRVDVIRASTLWLPPARYMRWYIVPQTPSLVDITFRIAVAKFGGGS